MIEKDSKLRTQVINVCKQLYYKGLIAASDGNVSVRLSGGEILITPSGVHKGFLSETDLVLVNSEGRIIEGSGMPSSELLMHIAIYKQDSKSMAVVHTHPPWTLALSLAGNKLLPHLLIEGQMFLGDVTVVPFERPGTEAFARTVADALNKGPAQILAHHGAVTKGSTLWKAFELMECLEHVAHITAMANILGKPVPLE